MAKSYILCKLPIDKYKDICYNIVTTEKRKGARYEKSEKNRKYKPVRQFC